MWGRRRSVDLVDTPEMDAFFARLERLNDAQLMGLRAAWHSTDRRAHEAAWEAVRRVGIGEGLAQEIERVRDRALDWSARGDPRVVYEGREIAREQARVDAGEALVDVALATALGDRLDEKSRETLMAPWLRITATGE
jgi:hypothetical protein